MSTQISIDGLPAMVGGVDDGDSLLACGLSANGLSWNPLIKSGWYYMNNEVSPRYSYASPESVTFSVTSGISNYTVALPTVIQSEEFVKAPTTLKVGTTCLTQVVNTTRFAVPVPLTNVVNAETLLDPAYISGTGDDSSTAISSGTLLWYLPSFGSEVSDVRQSQNPRLFDVMSDPSSKLYEVQYPSQLTNTRCYINDPVSGLVYGRFPTSPFPPPPYSCGSWPQTYVTLNYNPELWSPSGSSLLSSYTGYYNNAASGFEAQVAPTIYDPLRCEELTFVDSDGLIRVRNSNIVSNNNGDRSPSVIYVSPSGIITCTTNYVSGNALNAVLWDTYTSGYAALPYGSTVIARYYVSNSYCPMYLTGSSLIIRVLSTSTASGTLTYETETHSPLCETGISLNPMTNKVSSGFLYLQDAGTTLPVPQTASVLATISKSTPYYSSTRKETVLIEATAYDSFGSLIAGAPITISPSGIIVSSSGPVTAENGKSLFYVATSGQTTVTVTDTRSPGTTLATVNISPQSNNYWQPSIFVSLGESYSFTSVNTTVQARQMVRVFATQADAYPWFSAETPFNDVLQNGSASILLISNLSAFYDPSSGSDTPLGSTIQVQLSQGGNLISNTGVLSVGYSPVQGDILQAFLYVGDDRYASFPVNIG